MNRKDYPMWLRVALLLPLKCKHKIRKALQMAEFWSDLLVLENRDEITRLVENTDTPNFEEFDRMLAEAQNRWVIYDSTLATMGVQKRLIEFKYETKQKESQ